MTDDRRCPTCGLSWSLNPPVRCADENMFRCIGCKAVYSGEMLAAPDMLAALRGVLRVADRKTDEFDAARTAMTKAEGKS